MPRTSSLLRSRTSFATLLLIGSLGLGGCATSTALRQALEERDRELSSEKEAHAETWRRLQEALADRDSLQGRLQEASAPAPTAQNPAPLFPELDELGISTGVRDGQVVITLPSAITFPSGKADLSEGGKQALRAVGRRLKSEFTGATFFVEGHTDTDPIRKSTYPSNRELSLARSLAVHAFLVDECGVPDERFVIVGHGQYRPEASNSTQEGKARNRRVEIVVHSPRG